MSESDTSCKYSSNQMSGVANSKQISEYESAPEKIVLTIKGLTKAQLNYKINHYEWNINQILIHLADTEIFFYERIRRIIVEDNPLLQSFNQDEWANNLFYEKQNYQFALDLLIAQRKSTSIVLRLLPREVWKRKGIFEEKEKTLFDIFITAAHHIPTHIQQINKIKNDLHFPSS